MNIMNLHLRLMNALVSQIDIKSECFYAHSLTCKREATIHSHQSKGKAFTHFYAGANYPFSLYSQFT